MAVSTFALMSDRALQAYFSDNAIDATDQEWECLVAENAASRAKENIRESLWAFNIEALHDAGMLKIELSDKAIESLRKVQGDLCEDANEIIYCLVDDFDELAAWAIECDGLGHFLGTYDGKSIEYEYDGIDYIIIRTN